MSYPCPSCGFLVFDEPPGSYDICPVCKWEDDEVQLRFPIMAGGANRESLVESQQRILHKIPPEQSEWDSYTRHPDWRPLTADDIVVDGAMPKTGYDYFMAVGEGTLKYYWEK